MSNKTCELVEPSFLQNNAANEPLSSPYRNFSFSESEKIDSLNSRMERCGSDFKEYVSPLGEFKVLPVHCDNRACDKPECQKHRLYKYRRKHSGQINILNRSMRKPKAWVFTGWKFPIEKLDRSFCRKKLVFLFKLLKSLSVSEFSVHMEVKVYPKNHRDFGRGYLHFHVVSAGFKDLRFIRKRWGRQVRYEEAIKPESLGYYVSKYASKTPFFDFEPYRWYYHLLVYKTQMHRFSCKPDDSFVKSDWVCLDSAINEARNCLYRSSYLNVNNRMSDKNKGSLLYFKILEPPPKSNGLDDFGLEFIKINDRFDLVKKDDSPDPDYPFEPIVCKPNDESIDSYVRWLQQIDKKMAAPSVDDDFYHSDSYFEFILGLDDVDRKNSRRLYIESKKRGDAYLERLQKLAINQSVGGDRVA